MGWLWLCRSGIGVVELLRTAALHPATIGLLFAGSTAVLLRGVLTIGGASGALWLWHKVAGSQQEKVTVSTPNYAAYFGVSDPQLHRCRSAQICIVHHDADGRIIAIETETPRPPTAEDMSDTSDASETPALKHAA